MSIPVVDRLEPLLSHLIEFKLLAMEAWHEEHSYESRADQSKTTRYNYIYDRSYGFAKTAVTPIPISVEGCGRQRFIVVRDEYGAIAVWMKTLRRGCLYSSNNWTDRTQMMRELGTIYDMAETPELVICGHTVLTDTVQAVMDIDDIWLTTEKPLGNSSRRRIVTKLRRIYNRALGIMPELVGEQADLFTTSEPPVIVRPRQVPLPLRPTGTAGAEMPRVHPEPKEAKPKGEERKEKAEGA